MYVDVGELGLFLVAAVSVFAMPWTILRLARVAWNIETKQGRTDHHRRIVGMLTTNFLAWLAMLALALLTLWLMSTK